MPQERLPVRSPPPTIGERDRFLMVVKTYPSPSKRYGETVCCAGWDARTRDWVRVFPVNFRSLAEYARFRKWQFIEASWEPAKDGRPESRHVHQDSIRTGEYLPSGSGWRERRLWLDPLVVDSLEDLEADRLAHGRTLGVIRPAEILKLEIRPAQGWDAESKDSLEQLSLAWTGDRAPRGDLEINPYDFVYHFRCRGERCHTIHKMEIFDWEAAQAYRNWRRRYGKDGWEAAFRDKWERWLPTQDLHLVLGTHHQFKNWLIVGVLYPPRPKVDEVKRRSASKLHGEERPMTLPFVEFEAEESDRR